MLPGGRDNWQKLIKDIDKEHLINLSELESKDF